MSDNKSCVVAAVGLLSDVAESPLFDGPIADKPRLRRPEILERQVRAFLAPGYRNHFTLLESIVVFDEIQFDQLAFSRFEMSQEQRRRIDLLRPLGLTGRFWPKEVYEKTGAEVEHWVSRLRQLGLYDQVRLKNTPSGEGSAGVEDPFRDSREEAYHDGLFHQPDGAIRRWSFADSNQTFERALFYAELTRHLGLGMLPRARRGDETSHQVAILDRIAGSYTQTVHSRYTLEPLKRLDQSVRPLRYSIVMPPLAQKLIYESLNEGVTPLSVAAQMRSSPPAENYRRHLADLHHELRNPTQSSERRIAQLQGDFEKVVDKWSRDGVSADGVKYKTRRLNLEYLPAIAAVAAYCITGEFHAGLDAGAVTDLVGRFLPKSIVARDPILWGSRPYMAFVADWYDYS